MTRHAERLLGLICLVLALLVIFVWVPLDTESGLAEQVRRRWTLGDALGPTVAGAVVALGALLVLLRPAQDAPRLHKVHLIWMLKLLAVFAFSLTLMRYAGPAIGLLVEGGYRPLRNTVPWKFAGFLLSGTVLIVGLMALARGRVSWRDALIGLIASLLIALAYDLPFDDLILPPNGDL